MMGMDGLAHGCDPNAPRSAEEQEWMIRRKAAKLFDLFGRPKKALPS